MSAPISLPSTAIGGEPRSHEPSMEEILASIRRIIADDQSIPGRFRSEVDAAPDDAPATVHVLHAEEEHAVAVAAEDPPADSPAVAGADLAAGSTPSASVDEPMRPQGSVAAPQFAGPEGPRVDVAPMQQAPSAQRAETLVDHQPEMVEPVSIPDDGAIGREPPGTTATLLSTATNSAVSSAFNVLAASRLADNSAELLGMTREMVRPLLQTWLDDNLPALVERLVRDEIERVARGGR